MRKICIALVVVSLIVLIVNEQEKTPIQEATYEQLLEIDNIGPVIAKRIMEYKDNCSCLSDLLFDSRLNKGVKYVGKERLKELKKRFR